jgi:hypothetical protein
MSFYYSTWNLPPLPQGMFWQLVAMPKSPWQPKLPLQQLGKTSTRFTMQVLDHLRMHLSWPDFAEKEQ